MIVNIIAAILLATTPVVSENANVPAAPVSTVTIGDVEVTWTEFGVPERINIQGYVTTVAGETLSGNRSMTFKLYDAGSGGNELWSYSGSVEFRAGLFSIALGIPATHFSSGAQRWLEVTIEGQTLSPRVEVTSAAYAYRSIKSDTANYSTSASPSGPAGGDLTGNYPNPSIANNAVTSAKIQDGTIQQADLGFTCGDITGVYAGTGLTGGGSSGDVTLSFDANYTVPNADKVDNYHAGNSSGQVPISNGTLCSNLNADMLDGYHASNLPVPSHSHSLTLSGDITGSGNVPGTITTEIASGAVGSSEIADGAVANADLANNAVTTQKILDGTIQQADLGFTCGDITGVYAGTGLTGGGSSGDVTLSFDANYTVPNADKVDNYHAGNSAGQVAVSNGTVCTNLNADMLDGNHASAFAPSGHTHSLTLTGAISGSGSVSGTISTTLSDNVVTSSKISNGEVYTQDLCANCVTTDKIADGTILNADISPNTDISWSKIQTACTTASNAPLLYLENSYMNAIVGKTTASNYAGVRGEATQSGAAGVSGNNDHASGYGVVGWSTNGKGVYGWSSSGYGIYGQTGTEYFAGVRGVNTNSNGTGVQGIGGGLSVGSWTPAGSPGVAGMGLAYGVYGNAQNTSGDRAGGRFISGVEARVAAVISGQNYKIYGSGNVACVMPTRNGSRTLFAPELPEPYFEDIGEGALKDGYAHVELDPLFLDCVKTDAQHPLKVFVQLNDDCNGVYVKVHQTGFDVYELRGGRSNASFTYRVIANRRDTDFLRFPHAPKDFQQGSVNTENEFGGNK